jgi:hypothetical protein
MPIRREFPAESERPTAAEERTRLGDFTIDPSFEAEAVEKDEEILSPFPEDQLDIPTFLRRSAD